MFTPLWLYPLSSQTEGAAHLQLISKVGLKHVVSVSRLRSERSKLPPSNGTPPSPALSLSDMVPHKSNLMDFEPSERARIGLANTAFRRYAELQYSLSHTRCCKLRLSYRGETKHTHTHVHTHVDIHTHKYIHAWANAILHHQHLLVVVLFHHLHLNLTSIIFKLFSFLLVYHRGHTWSHTSSETCHRFINRERTEEYRVYRATGISPYPGTSLTPWHSMIK